MGYPPTLEVASVSELSVLDLPALGFPTRPMRGSRGILRVGGYIKRKEWKGCQSQWNERTGPGTVGVVSVAGAMLLRPFATTLRKDLPRLITAAIKEGQFEALLSFLGAFVLHHCSSKFVT